MPLAVQFTVFMLLVRYADCEDTRGFPVRHDFFDFPPVTRKRIRGLTMNIWKASGRITVAVGVWTICAGILFFVLAKRGQTFAGILIAVSGFAASPMTRGTSSGSSGQSMRKKVAIGSAALSYIMVLAFSDGPAPIDDEAVAAISEDTEIPADGAASVDSD